MNQVIFILYKNRIIHSLYRKACTLAMRFMAFRAYHRGAIDKEWKNGIGMMAAEEPSIHTYKMLKGFLGERIVLKKRAATWADLQTPTVVCVEKDSLTYMKKFLPYYRDLGVGHFIFIDNMSSDGTDVFLKQQKDVTLYSAPFPFEHRRKAGWLLQAIQEAGTARWYLRLDADEFLSWEGMETSSVPELIRKMKQRRIGTYRVIMADMYPSGSLMDGTCEDERFMEEYVYFDDAASYRLDQKADEYFGGMRNRTTGAYLRMDKYVIFRPDRGYFPMTNHNMTGIRSEEEKKCRGILRHYKFLPSESEKYLRIATDRHSGYSGFREISKYGKIAEGSVNALSEHSIRYESSASIRKLDMIEPL